MYQVGDWLEFGYYDRKYKFGRYFGQVKDIFVYPADPKRKGYLLLTRDGYRHFKALRMEGVRQVV